jgi:hypothetical protein
MILYLLSDFWILLRHFMSVTPPPYPHVYYGTTGTVTCAVW